MNTVKSLSQPTSFFTRLTRLFSDDIGIDLGTANTLVHVAGKGIIINEPSIVALNQKTGQVVAVGAQAKEMLGRTPAHITAIRPLVDGVISDFEIADEMLSYLIKKAQGGRKGLLGPRVIIGVPSNVTSVEVRAVRDAAQNAGARQVHIVEEPIAAAVGIGLPVHEPTGSMIIDIGGGTTDIGVISLGGLVSAKNLKIAGDRFNSDIITYVRNEFKILIGDKSAEELKIKIATAFPGKEQLEGIVRGRDLVTGLPREIVVTDADIREALRSSLDQLVESVKEVLERTPPEVVSDVYKRGIFLTGGGALIRRITDLLSDALGGMMVTVAEDPLTAVVRGTGIMLSDIETHRGLFITNDNVASPKN